MCGFWFLNISCSFHFRGVLIRSKLCYYPYTELKNLQKEKKMKNSPTKVCSSSVQQDKMIISHYKQEINTIDEETFLNDFNKYYDTEQILDQLRSKWRNYKCYVHGYVHRSVIINGAKYTLKLLRVKKINRDNPDDHETHVVLPSFLLPYMQNCVQDVIHVCIKLNILNNDEVSDQSDNTANESLASRIINYVPPCSSSFFSYIKAKLKGRIISSVKDLFRIFSRAPLNVSLSIKRLIFLI